MPTIKAAGAAGGVQKKANEIFSTQHCACVNFCGCCAGIGCCLWVTTWVVVVV
jgi:hypothetical protein